MKKKSYYIYIIYIFLLLTVLCITTAFSNAESTIFLGGTGTVEDPYQIETKQQLSAVSQYPEASFILTKDIIFEDADFESGGDYYNNKNYWDAICSPNSFKGIFDGNGHKISNLKLSDNNGLFNNVDSNGVVKNLTLENVTKVNARYGAICIYNYGKIENCAVTGNIYTGSSSSGMIAGFVGQNKDSGVIINCYNSATIYGCDSTTGGIVASNYGRVSNCFNIGNVTSKGDNITNRYSGGIAGTSSGVIENCYNVGYLNPSYDLLPGGIVGSQSAEASLINSYTISNFDSNELGSKLDVSEMQSQSTFLGFDFENIWTMDIYGEYPFPYLKELGTPIIEYQSRKSGGIGTNYDPYQINNAKDLNMVRNNLGACYLLTSNIDLSSYADWEPIGLYSEYTPAEDTPFVGRFIGNGYIITGMTSTQGGLFGANEGLISDIIIKDADVSLQDDDVPFGVIVGVNEGVIEFCTNKVDVSLSSDTVGGIVGLNYSVIEKCANYGTISSFSNHNLTGGIVGENHGYINSSYNCGKIAGRDAGGIAGSSYTENGIIDVFNIGNVTGAGYAGGIVGDSLSSKTIINNAYNAGIIAGNYRGAIIARPDSDTAAIGENVYSVDYHSNDAGVTALNLIPLDELDNQEAFVGFDFNKIWTMGSGEYTFPCFPELSAPVWGTPNDDFDGGTGTLADPYLISTLTQLKKIQEDTTNHFKLEKDIDLGNEIWTPISDMYFGGPVGFFGGVLDGSNRVIYNMACDSLDYSNGFVYANVGVIKNLNMYNASVRGSNSCVGIIAGQNYTGQISDCGVNGELKLMTYDNGLEKTNAGGITGINTGTVDESWFSGKINIISETNGSSYAGGIAGKNGGGSIWDSYSYLTVSGPQQAYRIGGIAGIGGSIDNTYSICDFSGLINSSWKPYGIVYNTAVTDSYYSNGESTEGATKLSLSSMQDKESFAGFDFDNVWTISEGNAPRLISESNFESIYLKVPVCEYEVGDIVDNISATVFPADSSSESIDIISSNEEILSPNGDGTFSAVGVGKAKIIAKNERISDSQEITVYPVTEKINIVFDDKEVAETCIYLDSTHDINAVVGPEGGNTNFSYSSNNTKVVSVTEDGIVSALSCGEAIISVTNSTSSVKGTIKVTVKNDIVKENAELEYDSVIYDGHERKPNVVVTGLEEGIDYTVSYKDNINAGTATVTINGKGDYLGTITKTFKIDPITSSELKATQAFTKKIYTGASIMSPTVTIKNSMGTKLVNGMDYTISRSSEKTVGRYAINITYKGNYSGTKTLYWYVLPKAPSKVTPNLRTVSGGYDDITVKWSKSTGATGYAVYMKKESGSYVRKLYTTGTTYTVKNLTDGTKYIFKIVPYYKHSGTRYMSTSYRTNSVYTMKKVTLSSVGKIGSKVKVRWKNISGETGYQISKSTKKAGTNIVYTYKTTLGTYKTLNATKGKTYYYKVRAYKTVDGKKVYGPWSIVKSYKMR